MGSRLWTPSDGAIDRELFHSASVRVGSFRCPADHPRFENSGPAENYIFVFPRRAVRLCYEGGRPFVADPGVVTLYNRGQQYERRALSASDDSDWFALDHALLLDAVRGVDPSVEARPERPFKHPFGPCDPRVYLAQRTLFDRLRAGQTGDVLWIEESVVWLLSRVLDGTYAFWGRPHAAADSARLTEIAEDAKAALAERLAEPLGLAHFARELGVSVFGLCRAFRAATGSTLHAYRNQLRLQGALERVAGGESLTEIALDFGYSSHSHFSAAFRRLFGASPSSVRRALVR